MAAPLATSATPRGRSTSTAPQRATTSDKDRWDLVDRIQQVALISLAAAVLGGQLKQLPPFTYVPIHPTIGFSVAALLSGLTFRFLTGRPPRLGPSLVAAALIMIVALGTVISTGGGYSGEKISRLLSLTLIAIIAAALSVDSERDAMFFLKMLAGWSAFTSLSLLVVGENAYEGTGRLVSSQGSTISFSRAAGYVLLYAVVWFFTTERIRLRSAVFALAVIATELFILISVASRGPLQGVLLGFGAVLSMIVLRQRIGGILRLASLAGLGVLGAPIAWSMSPSDSRDRILNFSSGGSANVREMFWRNTWDRVSWHPLGRGWGSWPTESGIDPQFAYPHNIYLEIWFEAGMLALLLIVGITIAAIWRQYLRRHLSFGPATLFLGALVFWLAGAQVSGDLNSNRPLLVVMVIVMAPGIRRADNEPGLSAPSVLSGEE